MFTVEQVTLMKMMYADSQTPDRKKIIKKLEAITDVEEDMQGLINDTTKQLKNIDDKAFQEIDFSLALD